MQVIPAQGICNVVGLFITFRTPDCFSSGNCYFNRTDNGDLF